MPNTELFEKMPIPRAAMKLMIPTVLSSLVTILYSLADTFFVGMLNNEIQTAAVALSAPALLAFNAVNNLFGVGSSSMMSRALGAGDAETVKKSSAFGFYGALISGAIFSLLALIFLNPLVKLLGADGTTCLATIEYMRYAVICGAIPSILNVVLAYLVRSEGNALHASVGTMSGCFLNIILDPIFILPQGLNMGAAGAGLATFLSNCAACIYFFILLTARRGKTFISFNPKNLSFKRNISLNILGVGVPAAIQNLLNVTGMTILNNFLSGYGAAAMAAFGIAHKIQMLPMQIALGASQGIMPLIGYCYANGNKPRFKGAIDFTIALMLPLMIFMCIIVFIFAAPLVELFMENAQVVSFGKIFLRCLITAMPFMLLDFTAVGVFQSVGLGKKALIFAILRKIVFEIPAIVVLNTLFGVNAITLSATVAEFILAICGMAELRKIINRFPVANGN